MLFRCESTSGLSLVTVASSTNSLEARGRNLANIPEAQYSQLHPLPLIILLNVESAMEWVTQAK